MSQTIGSKEAAAYLDPMNAPEPSEETGLGSHFGSTFAPPRKQSSSVGSTQHSPPQTSLDSNNPYRQGSSKSPPQQNSASTSQRVVGSQSSPRQRFPEYRAEALGDSPSYRRRSGSRHRDQLPPSYDTATSPSHGHRRRASSLKERYPGDESVNPLDVIRRDSKKANRSRHLKKHHIPGPDTIDKLDPAIGGRAYHHEGPFDAALLARNNSAGISPIAALQTSNQEALKATPQENIRDAVERHKPLDGVALVPPGEPDRFGRIYDYEEGADLMREGGSDGPGYKRWADKDYSPNDLKGQSEPSFSLDQALRNHKITDNGIEMNDGSQFNKHKHSGSADSRDPVLIAGDDSKYVDMEIANTKDNDTGHGGGLRDGLKKRIGSLRHKNRET